MSDEAKQFLLQYSNQLARIFLSGRRHFLVKRSFYQPEIEQDIIQELITMPDVEQAVAAADGIHVFIH